MVPRPLLVPRSQTSILLSCSCSCWQQDTELTERRRMFGLVKAAVREPKSSAGIWLSCARRTTRLLSHHSSSLELCHWKLQQKCITNWTHMFAWKDGEKKATPSQEDIKWIKLTSALMQPAVGYIIHLQLHCRTNWSLSRLRFFFFRLRHVSLSVTNSCTASLWHAMTAWLEIQPQDPRCKSLPRQLNIIAMNSKHWRMHSL